MIYLDSCALYKLVREEDESAALEAWLDERPEMPKVTSELTYSEVLRTVQRNNHTDQGERANPAKLYAELANARAVLGDVHYYVVLDSVLLRRVGVLQHPHLHSLDAIHLVSALIIGIAGLNFVTYDHKLAKAAHNAGLQVIQPR